MGLFGNKAPKDLDDEIKDTKFPGAKLEESVEDEDDETETSQFRLRQYLPRMTNRQILVFIAIMFFNHYYATSQISNIELIRIAMEA